MGEPDWIAAFSDFADHVAAERRAAADAARAAEISHRVETARQNGYSQGVSDAHEPEIRNAVQHICQQLSERLPGDIADLADQITRRRIEYAASRDYRPESGSEVMFIRCTLPAWNVGFAADFMDPYLNRRRAYDR